MFCYDACMHAFVTVMFRAETMYSRDIDFKCYSAFMCLTVIIFVWATFLLPQIQSLFRGFAARRAARRTHAAIVGTQARCPDEGNQKPPENATIISILIPCFLQ
jgi:hypothetical protein